MRRREFFTLLGTVAAWPLAARAQKAVTQASLGLLGSSTAAALWQLTAAVVQRLRVLGWIEGRNVTIEYRWAEGHTDRLAGLANELVRPRAEKCA
jgi:putative ABC transport system substrate-binding protein